MTKQLFEHAYTASLEDQLALEARAPAGGDRRRTTSPRACRRSSRSARPSFNGSVGSRTRPRIRDGRLPHGRRAVPDRDRRRRAAARARRSSTSAATRSTGSTTSAGCSSTSRAGTPTCTAASSSSRTTTAPTSASCSSTTRATRPRAGTGRSRSSPGRSTRASSSGRRARTTSSSTCPRAGSTTWAHVEDGRVRSVRFRNVPVVRLGRGRRARRSARSTSRSAARSTPPSRSAVEPGELPRLIELGRELKRELEAWQDVVHPLEPELRDIYGVIFWQEEGDEPADPAQRHGLRRRRGRPLAVRQRHVGAARAARPSGSPAARRGASSPQHRRHGVHAAASCGDTEVAGLPAVVTEVEGSAYRTGEHVFTLDPDDPLGDGFLLR